MTPALLFAAFGGVSLLTAVVLGYRLQRAEIRAALPPPSVEEARRHGWNEALEHAAQFLDTLSGDSAEVGAIALRKMKR